MNKTYHESWFIKLDTENKLNVLNHHARYDRETNRYCYDTDSVGFTCKDYYTKQIVLERDRNEQAFERSKPIVVLNVENDIAEVMYEEDYDIYSKYSIREIKKLKNSVHSSDAYSKSLKSMIKARDDEIDCLVDKIKHLEERLGLVEPND